MVSFSTTKVEYMEATHASKEAIQLMKLCLKLGLSSKAIAIQCDSKSAIFLAKNLTFYVKTNHIDIYYHFMRDMVEDGKEILDKVDNFT